MMDGTHSSLDEEKTTLRGYSAISFSADLLQEGLLLVKTLDTTFRSFLECQFVYMDYPSLYTRVTSVDLILVSPKEKSSYVSQEDALFFREWLRHQPKPRLQNPDLYSRFQNTGRRKGLIETWLFHSI